MVLNGERKEEEMKANSALLLAVVLSFIIDHVVDVGTSQSIKASGPLRVHPTNPRYFTDDTKTSNGSLRAVYLTESHHWNNLQESGETDNVITSGDAQQFKVPFNADAVLYLKKGN